MSTRNFVDLSSNNGPGALNAREYAAAGHVLIAVKATQGTGYVNPDWAGQVHAAHENHVPVLHYHYATNESGLMQARHFLGHLKASGLFHRYDGIAVDIERGAGIAAPAKLMRTFDGFCISEGCRNLVVYTELSYHGEHGLEPENGRLWIADYSGFLDGFWADQYTPSGRVHGIDGPVDVSRLSLSAWLYHRAHRP